MKKILAVLLAAVTVLCLFAACGGKTKNNEPEEVETLKSGDFEYVLLEDGTAEIVKFNATEMLDKINLPDAFDTVTVTSIGEGAFKDSKALKEVYLPRHITVIKKGAFEGSSIKNAFMVSCRDLKTVEENAFAGCESLVQVDLSSTVETIGKGAFSGCKALMVFTLRGDTALDANMFTDSNTFTLWTYKANKGVTEFGKNNNYEVKYLPDTASAK